MLYLGGLTSVVTLGLWIFCLVDVITTNDGDTRHLPKMYWLLIVLFLPLVGSIIWLVAGRPVNVYARPRSFERAAPTFPEYDRPGRFAATDAENDAEFLRRCRERAEEQRRKAREAEGENR
jgi:hypothetical protein